MALSPKPFISADISVIPRRLARSAKAHLLFASLLIAHFTLFSNCAFSEEAAPDAPSVVSYSPIPNLRNKEILSREDILLLVSSVKSNNKTTRAQALQVIRDRAASIVDGMILILNENKSDIQTDVLDGLKAMGPEAKRAVPSILKFLGDANGSFRASAAVALGHLRPESKQAVPALIDHLDDDNEDIRADSALALALLGEDAAEAVPALTIALSDENDEVRINAARALWSKGSAAKAAINQLQKNLSDSNLEVSLNSAVAFAKVGQEPKAIQVVMKYFNDKKVENRIKALNAFGQMGSSGRGAIPILKQALQDPAAEVREQALISLAKVGGTTPDVIHAMIRAREKASVGSLRWVFKAAGVSSWPTLFQVLKASFGWIRLELEEAFSEESEEAVEFFGSILKEKDPVFREWAIGRLGELGFKFESAVPFLVKSLDDRDFYVRQAATEAIRKLGRKAASAAPTLTEHLGRPQELTKHRATFLLKNIGPDAKEALPALQAMMSESLSHTKFHAALALKEIGTDQARQAVVNGLKDLELVNRFNTKPGRSIFLDQVQVSSAVTAPFLAVSVKDFFDYYDRDYLKNEPDGRTISNLFAVGIDNSLKTGDRLWLIGAGSQKEWTVSSIDVPAGPVGPFTKIRLGVRESGGSIACENSIPEGTFMVMRYPPPTVQNWKVRTTEEDERRFASEAAEKRLGEIKRNPRYEAEEKGVSVPLWTTLESSVIETKTHGNFLMLRFDTNANMEFAHYHVMVFWKSGEEDWKQTAGFDCQDANPVFDLDHDGVPELYGSTEYQAAVLWKFFPQYEVVATRSLAE